MKTPLLAAITCLMLSAPVALAAEQGSEEHDAHHPGGTSTAEEGIAPSAGGMAGMPMHEHMQTMRETMGRIHQTKDPKERQKLMNEHMQSMQDMMKMMHGMMAGQSMMGGQAMMGRGMMGRMGGRQGGMRGCPQGGEMMGSQPGGMMGGQQGAMMSRMNMMEQRMNMMQMMMDQMLQHQGEAKKAQ